MPHIHELYDFTVSFFILHPTKKKICLHWHNKLNCWNQLGGHIELDETPMDALERELDEEAGLKKSDYEIIEHADSPKIPDVEQQPVPFALPIYEYGKGNPHKHIDLPYVIQSKTDRLAPQQNESQQVGWFSIEEINKLHTEGKLEESTLAICTWTIQEFAN